MKKKLISLLIASFSIAFPIQTTLAYYSSSDNVVNTLKTQNYKIELQVNGGTTSKDIVIKNNKVILPELEKSNYNFLGYSLSENGSIAYESNDEIDISAINNKNLYAVYEQQVQKVDAIDKIKQLAEEDTINLIKDDGTTDHNTRFIGTNPSNYVKFSTDDTDKWRIVGLFNNIEDKNGNKGQRLKLVRETSIGNLVWDSEIPSIQNGFGINEWSDADLMKLLNPGYDNFTQDIYNNCEWDDDSPTIHCDKVAENVIINNSLWWNSAKGKCFKLPYNKESECDFTGGEYKGPSETAKSMFADVVWNLGGIHEDKWSDDFGTAQHFYNYERDTITYDCSETGATKCPRTTKWTGKVALLYPSDYGFAVTDGEEMTRQECLTKSLNHWGGWENTDCPAHNYLKGSKLFLSPTREDQVDILAEISSGNVVLSPASFSDPIYPAVFLKQNVSIVGGTGTSDDPYIFG